MTKNSKLPTYYEGKKRKIRAHHVISDFELSYNLGTAVTYLLRAGKKPGNPAEQDIRKAINHLQFELEKLDCNNTNLLINENTDCSY